MKVRGLRDLQVSMSQLMLAMTVGIVLVTAISIMLFVRAEMLQTFMATEDRHARNLVDTVTLNIETEYRSLLFHKERALAMRKSQLKDFVDVALVIIDYYYHEAEAGNRSEEAAKAKAKEKLQQMIYDNGNGYVWIHSLDENQPHFIMHPIMPEIEGKTGEEPIFYESTGNGEHLLEIMNDICRREGAGYVEYRWPKPNSQKGSELQPKMSYVALFTEWGWVIGSGTYIDDIDEEVQVRLDAILDELRDTISKVRLGENGYVHIFDGSFNMLVHPYLAGSNPNTMDLPVDVVAVMEKQIEAAHSPDQIHEYVWDKPGHEGDFRFRKRTYASYFAPLDWYVAAGVYVDEIAAPARMLSRKILLLTILFCAAAIAMALFASRTLSRPLRLLSSTAGQIEKEGIDGIEIPVTGPRETRELGMTLKSMAISVQRSGQALKESEERYRSIFENSNDAILIIGDGLVVDCNPRATELFGVSRKEMIGGSPWMDLSEIQSDGQEFSAVVKEKIELALEGAPQFFEWQGRRFDGSSFECEVLFQRIRIAEDNYVTAIIRDITERKKVEAERKKYEKNMRQAQKMEALGTLAGGIAHDFNNILTGIIGYGELALDDLSDPAQAEEHLDAMLAAAERAKSLVRQILTFSRRVETEIQPLEPHLIIKEAIKLLRSSIPSNVKILQGVDSTAGSIMADPAQIHQVVMNLCTNAYAAMHGASGTIEVRLDRVDVGPENLRSYPELQERSYVRITVSDSGSGMDRETISHIFEPFFTTKPKGEGTGLGLSTVHGIVKAMQGAIKVYSEPDQGTSFHIYLPRIECETTKTSDAEQKLDRGQGEHILLVDDELSILGIGSHMLISLGYAVTTKVDPGQALEVFAADPGGFDLVITDQAMPVMTGAELASGIRRIRDDIPIILTSGFSRSVSDHWMKDAGIGHFIEKPFQKKTLSAIVHAALEEVRRRRT